MSIKFPLLQIDGRSHPQESLVYQNRLLCMPGGQEMLICMCMQNRIKMYHVMQELWA